MGSESPHPILLYGDSLLLATVESRLRTDAGLCIIHIDPAHSTATEQLAALGQCVLLYDARTTNPELIQAIHVLHPRIPTVGLGSGDGRELVLLGREYLPAVMKSLARVLAAVSEPV